MRITKAKIQPTNFKVVIPARYQSRRFPGKPLCQLSGKPLIQHVYECASRSGASEVIVATDDQRIVDCVSQFGGESMLTSASSLTGSDRVAELVTLKGWADSDIIVNWQGDEPFLNAQDIQKAVAGLVEHPQANIATLALQVPSADLTGDNVVCAICDESYFALYFSRAIIPVDNGYGLRHIGIYVYCCAYLKYFASLERPPIEVRESLEQLRTLWHRGRIYVALATSSSHVSIDTQADLVEAEKILEATYP